MSVRVLGLVFSLDGTEVKIGFAEPLTRLEAEQFSYNLMETYKATDEDRAAFANSPLPEGFVMRVNIPARNIQ